MQCGLAWSAKATTMARNHRSVSEQMLDLTADAEVNGQKFDGVDCFLFLPHIDPAGGDDELRRVADPHSR